MLQNKVNLCCAFMISCISIHFLFFPFSSGLILLESTSGKVWDSIYFKAVRSTCFAVTILMPHGYSKEMMSSFSDTLYHGLEQTFFL